MPETKDSRENSEDYYRVIVRPKEEFETFRYQDVGEPGKIMRLAGKRADGSWDDHAWLIDKKMAHISNNELIGDDEDAKELLKKIGPAKHKEGDVFEGKSSKK